MRILRAICVMALCLAVLPWGAFAAHVSQPDRGDVSVQTIAHTEEGATLTATRRCHGPALPGAPCHPDPGLLPAGIQGPLPEGGDALQRMTGAAMRGITPARALDPPRAV